MPREGVYQDEFYRCSCVLAGKGGPVPQSELYGPGSTSSAIDFRMKAGSNPWDIKITRHGEAMPEHAARLICPDGMYTPWIKEKGLHRKCAIVDFRIVGDGKYSPRQSGECRSSTIYHKG